jgi:L,D-peptidoglycan transpeptidase YkuD (ErfK/YbiS/YcfS/YnhG family)
LKAPVTATGALLIGLISCTFACSTPPVPPEVQQVQRLEEVLRRTGVSLYAPQDYDRFQARLKDVRGKVAAEKAKFGWFRDYRLVRGDFQSLLTDGGALLQHVRSFKASKTETFQTRARTLVDRVERLKQMTGYFNESGPVRMNLSQAEIKLAEAGLLLKKEEYETGSRSLADGEFYVRAAEQAIADVLSRYLEAAELAKWKRWTQESIEESRLSGSVVFLVSKLERRLTIYKAGTALGTYEIGLGRYGLSDKLYSGDEATPEGKYKIIQKFPASDFYKALLINYPNDDDRKAFVEAKAKGLIPGQAGIGGAIEIHGGGKDSLTKGCVGMENKDMDRVYDYARVGTRVTIVGAVSIENTILAEIVKFDK